MAHTHHLSVRRQALWAALLCTALLAALVARGRPAQAQAPACQVTYAVNQWGNGFTADVTIRNNGAALTSWALAWSFGGNQQITGAWNAAITQSGAAVTARNVGWNGSIPGGGSVSFGFQGSYSGANPMPTSFTLNGVPCNDAPVATSTPTGTARPTSTPTARPSATPTGTARPTSTPTVRPSATPTQPGVPTSTPTVRPSATPTQPGVPTSTPTPPAGGSFTGNGTYFDALGSPYGGCGVPQSLLGTPPLVAPKLQDTPGDYATFLPRPISAANASKIGIYDNGRNCGRWVRVTLGDYCSGTNDGAPGQPFCRGGSGWVSDQYNGATLDFIVADSCQDGNAWCRDDRYHLDLARAGLSQFVKNGQPVGDLLPGHWNNRRLHWQFIEAPGYQGDIRVGFMRGASVYWSAIALTNLRNGLHAVEYYANGAWQRAAMNSDMGQSYIIAPTAAGGRDFQIRVYDANGQLINAGRVYRFSFPSACGSQCGADYTPVTYTTE